MKAGVKKARTVTATVSSISTINNNENLNSSTNMTQHQNNSSHLFPKMFGNKKLESILVRLGDLQINPQLVETMDESNPNLVLELLLESNKHTQITKNLTDDDIIIIFKYFNDFLTNGFPGNFQKLRELKIYQPLWGITLTDDKQQQYYTLENVAYVYILNEEWSNLIQRSFKRNFFIEQFHETKMVLLMQKEIESLSQIFTHLHFILPSNLEIFLQLCLPHFRKSDVKYQVKLFKYFIEDIDQKLFPYEKEQCRKQLHEHLQIFTQTSEIPTGISRSLHHPPEICSIYELYDPNIKNIRSILDIHHFPAEQFHTPTMLKFLKECGLRSYIPTDKCKQIMKSIQFTVKQEGWTNDQRKRSKYLYEHLLLNWTHYDNTILDYQFLPPYQMYLENDQLLQLHEQYINSIDTNLNDHFRFTCIKLTDGQLLNNAKLCWTSSYLLPEFIRLEHYNDLNEQQEPIEQKALEFFKLNQKPSYELVQKNLSNLAKKFSLKYDQILISVLQMIYHYFQNEIKVECRSQILKELEDQECIYSLTCRQFLRGKYFCLNLPIIDEIPPFLFSLDNHFLEYKEFFLHIGVQSEPHSMLYSNILRKLSKVCEDDYLNSNELCKSLKAMEGFFKYFSINSQRKLFDLYLVTNDFKLVKSNDIIIMDDRTKLDYMTKLIDDKFMFNPNECVFKLDLSSSNNIRDLIDQIFVSQRPILFSQKYEELFSITIPEDKESTRQHCLFNLERKYNQLLSSHHFHRCMACVIANHLVKQQNPKIISINDVENLIRQRLTFVKVTCVEDLQTNLIYKKTQQKVDQSIEEKAVYLVTEGGENLTCYISIKHTEETYFTLCLARALSPCLGLFEIQLDNSVMTALLATTIGQTSELFNLVNIATEENILSIHKFQYIPSPGNVYGNNTQQLQQFNIEQHQILPGDLCVYRVKDLYIYCEVEQIIKETSSSSSSSSNPIDQWSYRKFDSSFSYIFLCKINDANEIQKIEASHLYVLEHWSRIFDAVHTKPVDERDYFKPSSTTNTQEESSNARRKRNDQQSEADRWFKQAQDDLQSSYNDMHSSNGQPAYDWACYKCYRATEKALKAYHYYKDMGKTMTADIPGLLIDVDNGVGEIGSILYKWIGDPHRMQYPNAARFAKIPAEVFTVSQAEQAIEYTRELLNKIEDIMYP